DVAVNEAINVLRRTPRLSFLQESEILKAFSENQAMEINIYNGGNLVHSDLGYIVMHPNNKIWNISMISENLAYMSPTASSRDIVVAWIIDKNVPNRGHRNNLLNPEYNSIGSTKSGTTSVQLYSKIR